MSDRKPNGLDGSCSLRPTWHADRAELKDAATKVSRIDKRTEAMFENTKHLENLGLLQTISDNTKEMKDNLVNAVTGKNHVPLPVALCLFAIMAVVMFIDRVIHSNVTLRLPGGFEIVGHAEEEKKL